MPSLIISRYGVSKDSNAIKPRGLKRRNGLDTDPIAPTSHATGTAGDLYKGGDL